MFTIIYISHNIPVYWNGGCFTSNALYAAKYSLDKAIQVSELINSSIHIHTFLTESEC